MSLRSDGFETVGQQPEKTTEKNAQDCGRHSNLPFDETKSRNGRRRGPHARANSKARPLRFHPPEKAFRPAGLLASGSLAAGLLPERSTDCSIRDVQWFAARGVPGDSGGGRAGFSPASL